MTRRERLTYLFLWLSLGLLPLFLRPLWEPDEGRYAEIPREMLATGDWLTPRLNSVLYFEKPPLQYWISAISLKCFGLHPWAARLPLALAAAIMLWCAWKLARRLGARDPRWAMVMAATSILGFITGQILTLDALFSAFVVLAFVAGVEAVARRAAQEPGALAWTLGCYAALALAFLVKGPAAVIMVFGALLLSLFFAKGPGLFRAVLRTLFDPLGWLLGALLAAPWFVLVNKANPDHAWFFFVHENFARFTTHEHARQGSNNPILDKLYFAGVLLGGLMPWLSACLTGLKRSWGFARRGASIESPEAGLHRWVVGATWMAFAWPFLFFSVSGSKLPPYILPVLVPLCALACAFEREGEELKGLRRMGGELIFAGAMIFGAALAAKHIEGRPWVAVVGAGWLLFGFWCFRPRFMDSRGLMAGLAACMLLLTVGAERVAGKGKEVAYLVAQAPRGAQWISFGVYRQGLPFHSGQRVVVIDGTGELAFGREHLSPAEQQRWMPEDPLALLPTARRMRAEDPRPVYLIGASKDWARLPQEQRDAFEVLDSDRSNVLAKLK